jgi:hypothetical protein
MPLSVPCVAVAGLRALPLLLLCACLPRIQGGRAPGNWRWVGGNKLLTNNSESVPGGRCCGHSWLAADNNTLWLFGGSGYSSKGEEVFLADLWSYNTEAGTWHGHGDGGPRAAAAATWPSARFYAVHWTQRDGSLWLWSGFGQNGYLDDMWRLQPPARRPVGTTAAAVQWQPVHTTSQQNPPARCWAHSWTRVDELFVFSGSSSDGEMLNDLWHFDATQRSWRLLADYGSPQPVYRGASARPGARENGYAMADQTSGLLWLYGGNGYSATDFGGLDDLWTLDVSSLAEPRWTFQGGTSSAFSPWNQQPLGLKGIGAGVYGKQGVPAKSNLPSAAHAGYAWSKSSHGRLWIMGGEDDQANTNGHGCYGALWALRVKDKEWEWEAGPKKADQPGNWSGGLVAGYAYPAVRYAGSAWIGPKGRLWLFGGWGLDAGNKRGYLSDMWLYSPSENATGHRVRGPSPPLLPDGGGGGGGGGGGILKLRRTINNSKDSAGHDGLQYVVQARSYVSSPNDLVATMRGGGVAVWRWLCPGGNNRSGSDATVPTLAVRSFVMRSTPTEGQDSMADLLVVVRLNHGITTLDWPSMAVRGQVDISVTGALHCKLWRDVASGRVFALVTTGLTHVEADRDYLVALEVTDRTRPREVAKLKTPVRDTEGVLVVGHFAYVGGYVSNNLFVSVDLRGLVASPPSLTLSSVAGPRPEYDNMVGAIANSSFRFRGGPSNAQPPTPIMYFGSYARPGGLLAFAAFNNGSVAGGSIGSLIANVTSRTNRVHISPDGHWALLALEKGVVGTDQPPAGETGGMAVIDIRDIHNMSVAARAPSPVRGGRVYTASWSPSQCFGQQRTTTEYFFVSFSAQNQSAFIYSFEASSKVQSLAPSGQNLH